MIAMVEPEAINSRPAQNLLSALVHFVHHLVPATSAAAAADISNNRHKCSTDLFSVEGQLVHSLKELIQESINEILLAQLKMEQPTHVDAQSQSTAVPNALVTPGPIPHFESDDQAPQTTGSRSGLTITKSMLQADQFTSLKVQEVLLHEKIAQSIEKHVSSMPKRLLAFDATGSSIRLIEQREAVQVISPAVRSAARTREFQVRWRTHALRAWGDAEYVKARDALVDELVAQHAVYAILSHTWSKDPLGEVPYRAWVRREDYAVGNDKIMGFCRVAARIHGCQLGWLDTVCINKESSSELDEAVRSMYKWYRGSAVCVVYLAQTTSAQSVLKRDPWFTRGWTLQELVAPRRIQVYNKEWTAIEDADLESRIERAAGISAEEMALFRRGTPEAVSISRRLQMASRREVTREEDSAYSLMGMLDVSISTAYGEGAQRAFSRLMRELLNTKRNILDLFNHSYRGGQVSVVPDSIALYADRSQIFDRINRTARVSEALNDAGVSVLDKWAPSRPLLLTHVGLRMYLLLVPGLLYTRDIDYIVYNQQSLHSRRKASRSSYDYNMAKGDFYGHYNMYDLLHRRLYSKKWPSSWVSKSSCASQAKDKMTGGASPPFLIFAVINFGIDNNHVLLPDTCLSIPLDCRESTPGNVRPSDSITIHLPHSTRNSVPVFQLRSKNARETTISERRLGAHGLQLITLYL